MKGLLRDTVLEMFDRKLIWLFIVVTLFGIAAMFFSGTIFDQRVAVQGLDIDDAQIEQSLSWAVSQAVDYFLFFMVGLAILGTAGLVPRMLERGRADFYLSKPVSRRGLLLGKYSSIFLIYGVAIAAGFLCMALAAWAWLGVFDLKLLYILLLYLVSLAIMLGVTLLVGIWSGSGTMSIIAAFVLWVLQKLLLQKDLAEELIDSKAAKIVLDVAYYIVPKTSQMSNIAVDLSQGVPPPSFAPIWTSCAFGVLCLVLASIVFNRRDY